MVARLNSPSVHIILTILELFLCGLAVFMLVYYPSCLREELRRTQNILFSSLGIWETYDPKVFDIGRIFVAHLNVDDLGVSIWSFVMISKQFILSVVSITMTLVVFLLGKKLNLGP